MKKSILLIAVLASSLSFAQEKCCNVITTNGINAVTKNGNCVITSGAAHENCEKGETAVVLKAEETLVLKNALEGVKFKSDSDALLPESNSKLHAVAELMNAHQDFKLTIDGYTDNTGSSEHNHQLSLKRAEAAKAYLVQDGIEASRITTHGFGEEKPIDTNDTAKGRAHNRRVEFSVQ